MNQNQPLQSVHWLDQVISEIVEWGQKHHQSEFHVDDMKTPSGRVHTGALRGVLLHDLVAKVLATKIDQKVLNTYVFNDMDAMDSLPGYLPKEKYEQYMGWPVYKIPAPELSESGINTQTISPEHLEQLKTARSFAEFYARDFIYAFSKLGATPELIWSHDLYESGQMNDVIREALDNVAELKKIYQEIADYQLPEKWYPLQVICPNCSKVGTTLVNDWDGTEVSYECLPNKVTWAVGCGHSGRISPFDGNAKFLWKVDWPAHWKTMGVNVEGAGKDHASAGGSRDMAMAICERVFHIENPFDIPYEWILIRGAKMSSSKGVGTSAVEFTQLFPAAVGRFLFANRHYGQVIDFDPGTMAIPDLFDEYDQAARIYWQQETGDERFARSFELAQSDPNQIPQPMFLARFRDIAVWMQHPELNLTEEFTKIKGSELTSAELELIAERQKYAQIWLERYALEEFNFTPQAELPVPAEKLSFEQKAYLEQVFELLKSKTWEPQELQTELYQLAKNTLGSRPGFEAIYLAYLGKKHGPRAGWLLLSLTPEFHDRRRQQLSSQNTTSQKFTSTWKNDGYEFSFGTKLQEKYPSISVGLAVITGVKIVAENPDLNAEKAAFLASLQGLTTQDLNTRPSLLSYRQLYKSMGIDWHSRRPSPEALLRRVAQGKDLRPINTCVDAYNLVVMKHGISVGAFNLDAFTFPTSLEIAQGGENILLLGETEPTTLKAGEISYFDAQGPYNLDFNYRDAQRTAVTEETTNLLINVDGVFDISPAEVAKTLQETVDIITKYCGGTVVQQGIVVVE